MVISTKTEAASLTATNPRDPTQSELACVFLAVKPICFDTAVRCTEHARTVMSRLSLSVAWLRKRADVAVRFGRAFLPRVCEMTAFSATSSVLLLETRDEEAQPPS